MISRAIDSLSPRSAENPTAGYALTEIMTNSELTEEMDSFADGVDSTDITDYFSEGEDEDNESDPEVLRAQLRRREEQIKGLKRKLQRAKQILLSSKQMVTEQNGELQHLMCETLGLSYRNESLFSTLELFAAQLGQPLPANVLSAVHKRGQRSEQSTKNWNELLAKNSVPVDPSLSPRLAGGD